MRRHAWLLTAALPFIVLLGASLRLLGISFGLPYHHHWDEGWVVDSAAGMLRHHDGVPASYQYGAPLMRLTELAFVLIQCTRRASWDVTPLDARTTLFLAGRLATAVVSSTGIVAVYLATRFAQPRGAPSAAPALAAALLYAASSELVLHSRYAVTDACLVAFTAWTLAFASLYLARGRVVWGALAAVAAGVTFAFKVPGIMTITIPLLAALILSLRARHQGGPRRGHGIVLGMTIPSVIAIFLLLNPHFVDRSHQALHDLVSRYRQTRDGGFSRVYLRGPGLPHLLAALWAIWTQFLSGSVPVSVALSAVWLWGMVQDIRRRNDAMIVAAAFAVLLVLSVALPNRTFLYRNYLVVIPSLCLGFGSGVVALVTLVIDRLAGRPGLRAAALSLLGTLGAAAVVGLPVVEATGLQRHRADPRVEAIDWVAGQVQGEARPAEPPAEVGTTSSVFGKTVLEVYPELRGALERPGLRFTAAIDACPPASPGPEYVIDASYRDTSKAPASDPWEEQWFFRRCPGYQQVAAFEASPYEVNLRAYPTWNGRVSAIVLRRQ
jgi:4-amino-4-deoxy-L-arabinose transferase-like glycosyltransferase